MFLVKSLLNWGYDNISHRNDRVNKLLSHDHIYDTIWVMGQNFVGDDMDTNYDVITFCFKNSFILRRPRVSWKLQLCLLRKPLKIVQRKLFKKLFKELEIIYENATYICISWYNKSCWFSEKKYWCQQNSRGVSRDLYFFWDLF